MTKVEALDIRPLTEADLPALSMLARETFFKTFDGTCSAEDMEGFLEANYSVEAFKADLKTQGLEIWLGWVGERLSSYLQLHTSNTIPELQGVIGLEVQRLYVDYTFHGQLIAQQLMDFAYDRAKTCGRKTVWLGVWEHNERAKRFYVKSGFEYIGSHPFPIGNTPQTDLWMKKELA